MFTGIIEAVGQVRHVEQRQGGVRLVLGSGSLPLDDIQTGDSIAVDGCCLTVIALAPDAFHVDVSDATLTTTAGFAHGAVVNLEKALRLSDRIGGHLVTGHVDGRGEVSRMQALGENTLLEVRVPVELSKYIARKGSVTVNGVSLTVNEVERDSFRVNLIPHTLRITNLRHLRAGQTVNIEIDLLARYVERLASASDGDGK
ncbi:MAG: riboflavin synthase [Betaproteobacteria bacterium]